MPTASAASSSQSRLALMVVISTFFPCSTGRSRAASASKRRLSAAITGSAASRQPKKSPIRSRNAAVARNPTGRHSSKKTQPYFCSSQPRSFMLSGLSVARMFSGAAVSRRTSSAEASPRKRQLTEMPISPRRPRMVR